MTAPKTLWGRLRREVWFRGMIAVRGMSLGVRVLAFNPRGEVLLVRHGYTPGWHLPGGGVDYGETLEEGARRELEEETGYRATGAFLFRGIAYNHRQWRGDHVALFVAQSLEKVRDFTPGFEIKEVGFFPVSYLPEGTTAATRARLAEWQDGATVATYWTP